MERTLEKFGIIINFQISIGDLSVCILSVPSVEIFERFQWIEIKRDIFF